MLDAFNQDLSSWNTAAVTNMQDLFYGATAFNGNISSWNTAAVTIMQICFMVLLLLIKILTLVVILGIPLQ